MNNNPKVNSPNQKSKQPSSDMNKKKHSSSQNQQQQMSSNRSQSNSSPHQTGSSMFGANKLSSPQLGFMPPNSQQQSFMNLSPNNNNSSKNSNNKGSTNNELNNLYASQFLAQNLFNSQAGVSQQPPNNKDPMAAFNPYLPPGMRNFLPPGLLPPNSIEMHKMGELMNSFNKQNNNKLDGNSNKNSNEKQKTEKYPHIPSSPSTVSSASNSQQQFSPHHLLPPPPHGPQFPLPLQMPLLPAPSSLPTSTQSQAQFNQNPTGFGISYPLFGAPHNNH